MVIFGRPRMLHGYSGHLRAVFGENPKREI